MNDSSGFIKSTQNLVGFSEMSAAMADYDNDNDLDLIICGDTAGWHTPATVLYRNDDGVFNRTSDIFRGVHRGVIKWADIDNDGDQDIIVTGLNSDWWASIYIYENLKDSFNLKNTIMCGFISGFIEPADYDKDGDIDLLIGGSYGCGGATTLKIYNNVNGNFEEANLNMEGLFYCSGKWGDYDSDGDLDIIINGTMTVNGDGDSTILYRNNTGTFERINHQIPSTRNKIHFVDYDNDGDLDVIGGNRLSQNNENTFIERPSNTPELHTGIQNPHVEPGDYDNDGDVDLLGWNEVYRNDACDMYNTPNLPPSAPVSISNIIHYDTVHFSWGAAIDDKTTQLSLTYNLRVGTTPGGNQILSSLSDPTGWRKIVGMGNVQQNTSWWLKLPEGTYYWSVQAIDNSFAGGSFSSEQTFNIIKHPQITKQPLSSVRCPGDSIIISIETDHYFPVNYQWYKNNMIISGATDSIYTKSAADSSDIAQYFCIVSNDVYNTYSDTISIHVEFRPVFVTQPVSSLSNCPGDSISISVEAESCSPISYQWYRNDIAISGATDSIYAKNNVDSTDIGQYYCRLSNAYLTAYSDTIMVDVYTRPYFTMDTILSQGNYQIGDFEGDGDLDFLFTDSNYWNPKTQVYLNNWGNFTLSDYLNLNVNLGEKLFADFNSDGKIDVLFFNSDSVRMYLNNGESLTRYQTSIPNTNNAKVMSGDMDNDGDLDLVFINRGSGNSGASVKILYNQDLIFLENTLFVPDPLYGHGLLIDYDQDGDLDIYYSGFHYYWNNPLFNVNYFARILRNDQTVFTEIDLNFGTENGSSSIGDFNNDGQTDIIISANGFSGFLMNDPLSPTGFNMINGGGIPAGSYFGNYTKSGDFDNDGFMDVLWRDEIYYNTNGNFIDSSPAVAGLPGDYNNNGTLDLIAGGEIYSSQSCAEVFNTPPTSPAELSVSIIDSISYFSWSRASDAQTPQLGLSYNLRVGISPGGSEIMSASSNQDGYRQIVDIGNVQQNTSWWIKNLSPGTYYWSVQAIDNSFAGGPFASEQAFTVEEYNSLRLSTKVFLEGAYNPATTLMNNVLLANDLIPGIQPYDSVPWNYAGVETITVMPDSIIDWVLVELRQAASPELATAATILEGWPKALLLKSDGSIVGVDNNNPLIGNAVITENLYIVVRHRNHLDVLSNGPLVLAGNTYTYDFTDAITKAYGGPLGYKQIASGIFGMVAGDSDADGEVSVLDFSTWASQFGGSGVYSKADNDLDGEVSVLDFSKWAINFGIGNPFSNPKFQIIYRSQVPGR